MDTALVYAVIAALVLILAFLGWFVVFSAQPLSGRGTRKKAPLG
jgi:hypothetical protein